MKQENRSEIIHDALNLLDDEMIEEVDRLRGGVVMDKTPATEVEENEVQKQDEQKELRPWRKLATLAASVCILIVIGGVWNASIGKGTLQQSDGNMTMEDAENQDALAEQEENKDMQSGTSVFEDDVESESIDGELLLGENYRLENYIQVSYLTCDEWTNQDEIKKEAIVISEEYSGTIDKFIASVQKGTCILVDAVTEEIQGAYHLFFTMQDGATIHLVLFGEEYVCYYGMESAWIRVDKELYKAVTDIIENR